MKLFFLTLIAAVLAFSCTGCTAADGIALFSGMGARAVGKKITEDKFREFYYTYASTVNPPEYQRYRFYRENGKAFFYHEKREGNKVFLTEDDITVCGTKELSGEEWNTFWKLIEGSSVRNRKENANSGGPGPWLYLYWDGDKDICQEFTFKEHEALYEFEVFCEGLVESMDK